MKMSGGAFIPKTVKLQVQKKGASSTNTLLPEVKSKRIKIIRITVAIMLIIGVILVSLGVIPMLTAKNVEDVKNDQDISTNNFKSYDKGDRIIITGKILTIIKTKYLLVENKNVPDEVLIEKFGGKFIYILEKNLQVYANTELGKKGDKIIVVCEVDEIDNEGNVREILKANPYFNSILFICLGLGLLIVGIVTIVKVIRKKKESLKVASKPYQLAELYETIETDDEEAILYQFLQSKDQKINAPEGQPEKEKNAEEAQIPTPEAPSLQTIQPMPTIIKKPARTPVALPVQTSPQTTQPQLTIGQKLDLDYDALKKYYHSLKIVSSPQTIVQDKPVSAPGVPPGQTRSPLQSTQPKPTIIKKPARAPVTPPVQTSPQTAQQQPTFKQKLDFDYSALRKYYQSMGLEDDEGALYKSMQSHKKK